MCVLSCRCSGFSAWRRGLEGAERAFLFRQTPTAGGGSWVMFVNTHCGWILYTLYLLWTLYVGRPPPLLPSSTVFPQGLWWKCCACVSSSSPVHCNPRTHHCRLEEYTSCGGWTTLPSPPHPSLLPFPPPSTSPLHYRLWSAVTLCIMVLHPAWTVSLRLRPSGRRASVTLCLNALLQVRL